ncbi:MAG TPA: hypothetical protein VKA38_11405 [Draconibacterium sp.]|nr:hypothetical protein [Draconibacterium sp.]
MKKALVIFIFLIFSKLIFAQNEVGPDGNKLIWVILIAIALAVVFLFLLRKSIRKNTSSKKRRPFFAYRRVRVELTKDRLYYPDKLRLIVKNIGNTYIDLDRPLLVFDRFWLQRKFRLNGIGNRLFYPLYLEKKQEHTLEIDINRFYYHDKTLKRFPKTKIIIYDVKGKRLGSKSIYLRKTLFKF